MLTSAAILLVAIEARAIGDAIAWDLAKTFNGVAAKPVSPGAWVILTAAGAIACAILGVVLAAKTGRLAWIGGLAIVCCLVGLVAVAGVASWIRL